LDSVSVTGADVHVKLDTQVGQPYDAATVKKDVRYLWSMGRFDDVRAELSGSTVRFAVTPKPRLVLHEIRMSPHSFGMQPKLPAGSPIDELRAHEVAAEVEKQLRGQGYMDPHVSFEFESAPHQQVDLRLNVDAGRSLRKKDVAYSGELGLDPKELRGRLTVEQLKSLYWSKGFFDVTAEEANREGRLGFEIHSGPRYEVRNMDYAHLCPCLMSQRREAEREGVLDFNPMIHVERTGAGTADVTTEIERGQPFRVGRIEFFGSHHYGDATIRRNLLLDEGAVFDEYLLRKSIARFNQTQLFMPLDTRDIVIARDDRTGVADIKLRLTDRRPGSWLISGPVGPASLAGPVRASIMTRLPGWGRGLFELSTYTASISLMAFAQPIIPGMAVKKFMPVFALTRPYLPGDWKSGLVIAPQFGWQGSLLATAGAQLQGRLLPPLTGMKGLTPDLAVSVDGRGAMLCESPKPRLRALRTAASFALRMSSAMTGL
jgi:hypothetical protein